jgi:hypothetical protein
VEFIKLFILSFSWRCFELTAEDRSCFIGSDIDIASSNISNVLEIPGSDFKEDVKSFVFELTIWKENRDPRKVTQVLQLESEETIQYVSLPHIQKNILLTGL